MIAVNHLSFAYGKKGKLSLSDISFELPAGSIGVLLGANGAGKSTLLKCVLGTLKPSEGEVLIEGKNIKELKGSVRGQKIAYLPQNNLFAPLSVYETVMLGRLPYFGIEPQKKDREFVDSLLAEFGLEDFKERNVLELSGGEQQKVAIARAMAQEPSVLILDEPNSSLDIKNESFLFKSLRRLAKDKGIAILISLHNIQSALSIGDYYLLLRHGEGVAYCSKEELTDEAINTTFGVQGKILDIHNKKIFILEEKL